MKTRTPSRAVSLPLVVAAFALLGVHCAKDTTSPPPATSATAPTSGAPSTTSAEGPGAAARPGQKEGDLCGGIAGLQCAEGLTCKMSGPVHPDQAGTCAKP